MRTFKDLIAVPPTAHKAGKIAKVHITGNVEYIPGRRSHKARQKPGSAGIKNGRLLK